MRNSDHNLTIHPRLGCQMISTLRKRFCFCTLPLSEVPQMCMALKSIMRNPVVRDELWNDQARGATSRGGSRSRHRRHAARTA